MRNFLALLFLTLMSVLEPAAAQTGSTLLENCTLAVRHSDGNKLEDRELIKALSCIDYVSGFLDATGMIHSFRPQTQIVCMPVKGITNDRAIRVLVKHLRSTPENLHDSGRISLLIALTNSFPCPK